MSLPLAISRMFFENISLRNKIILHMLSMGKEVLVNSEKHQTLKNKQSGT